MPKRYGLVLAGLVVMCHSPAAMAQEEPAVAGSAVTPPEGSGDSGKPKANDPLASFKFGGAIGVSVDLMDGTPVVAADLVNGLVRVKESASARPRVLLEVHRPILTSRSRKRTILVSGAPGETARAVEVERAGWGVGPFAAIQSGGNSVVDGFAAGAMVSILRKAETGSDFNIGLGLMLDQKVKFLGDGIAPDQALPTGETEVRYHEKAAWSFVVILSIGQ